MLGYAGREGVAVGTDSELYATALVLDDERTRVAIVSLDLALVQDPLASALRSAIGRRLGVLPSHVLLNASHTHSGPTLQDFHYDDDPEQDARRQAYAAYLLSAIPDLAERAAGQLSPARLGTATGEARIGINRRELQPDGTVILGENPSGSVDHEVRVVRVDDLDGRPLAVVFAHGCHTVTMGPKCLRWSSDYVGPARELIERSLGCLSLFLQANAGDINPITGIGSNEDDTEAKNRIGLVLGGEVLKVVASIYTNSVRGPRTFFGTLAKASVYPRVKIDREPDYAIAVREVPLDLPLQEFPDLTTAQEIFAHWEAEVIRLKAEDAGTAALNVARRWRHWAGVLLESVRKNAPRMLRGPLQVIRIGELAIAAFPGETFAKLGIEVKRRSPLPQTLFLGYSNGCLCYIPTRDAFPPNGWSIEQRYYVPDMLFQAYAVPTALLPQAGELVVEKALELIGAVASGSHSAAH
jgi:hypothetical protein